MLNGEPSVEPGGLEAYLGSFTAALAGRGHEVRVLNLREMRLGYCLGCWGCWVRTPGECVIRDDQEQVCRAIINADLFLFASPVIMGFTSALLKKAHDRLIPLIHPYIQIYQGELHHRARYGRRPLMGLLLDPEAASDAEEIAMITEIYRRNAINLQTSLVFAGTTETAAAEAARSVEDAWRKGKRAAIARANNSGQAPHPETLAALARPEKLPWFVRGLLMGMARFGLFNSYWNRMLRENGVYARRFARPYQDEV